MGDVPSFALASSMLRTLVPSVSELGNAIINLFPSLSACSNRIICRPLVWNRRVSAPSIFTPNLAGGGGLEPSSAALIAVTIES